MNQNQETLRGKGAMHRREFIISGVKASLCFIACDALTIPTFGAKPRGPGLSVADPSAAVVDSLHVIAEYLTGYTPPAGNFPASGSWRVNYDLITWSYPKKSINRVLGSLAFTRLPTESGVTYEVDYRNMLYEFESSMKSSMHCSADRLPRLIDWKTEYETHVDAAKLIGRIPNFGHPKETPLISSAPPVSLNEQGRHKDGVLEITTKLGTRKLKTDRPVAPQWAVLDALRNSKADPSDPMAHVEFDLLHNLTSYRPSQRLKPAGVLDICMGGGKPQTFHGFIQTGFGTQPTHYWIDSDGRPLIVTEGIISCALTKIEAV